ncbi:MAG: alpha/beta hydrolase [Chloroflexota bacterium]
MIVLKSPQSHTIKQTHTIDWKHGQIVLDVWQPKASSGNIPILLLHGWGNTGTYWQETARALSETVPVIVPDLPGTGRSQPVGKAQNLFEQVENIQFILDSLKVDAVQVVGHSMGGAMAVLVAGEQPERVKKLVLTSVTFFKTQEQVEFYKGLIRFFDVSMRFRPNWLEHLPGLTNMLASQYFYRLPDDPAVLKQGLRDYLSLHAGTAIASAKNATDPRIREAGHKVTAPTLMVVARQDNMMPKENVQFTADIIGDCEVRWIEECGHMPMIEKPDEYLAILQDFLAL